MNLINDSAAVCGLFCGICPSFGNECGGCLSDNCVCDCYNGFKDCAVEHSVVRCYECNKFPCKKLKTFSKQHIVNGICQHKDIITDLKSMKENGLENWVEQKTIENTCQNCNKIVYWFDKDTHKC